MTDMSFSWDTKDPLANVLEDSVHDPEQDPWRYVDFFCLKKPQKLWDGDLGKKWNWRTWYLYLSTLYLNDTFMG